MKNKHFSLIVLIITAFTLAACQPATMPVATQPQAAVETPVTDNSSTPQNAGGFVPNLAGPITECRLEQSIPVIPPDQIPPIPGFRGGLDHGLPMRRFGSLNIVIFNAPLRKRRVPTGEIFSG